MAHLVISPISPLYLPCISPVSPLYLTGVPSLDERQIAVLCDQVALAAKEYDADAGDYVPGAWPLPSSHARFIAPSAVPDTGMDRPGWG